MKQQEKRRGSQFNNKFIQIRSSFKKQIHLSDEMDDYQSQDDDKHEVIVEAVNDENSQSQSLQHNMLDGGNGKVKNSKFAQQDVNMDDESNDDDVIVDDKNK